MPIVRLCAYPSVAPMSRADGSTADVIRFEEDSYGEPGVADGRDDLEVELADQCLSTTVEEFVVDRYGFFADHGSTPRIRLDAVRRSTSLPIAPGLYAEALKASLPAPVMRVYEKASYAASDFISGAIKLFR